MTAPTNVVHHSNGDVIHQYRLDDETRASFPTTAPANPVADVFWVRQSLGDQSVYVGFNREAAANLVAALRAEGLV